MLKLAPKNLRPGIAKTPLDIITKYRVGWYGHLPYEEGGWSHVIEWTHCRDLFQGVDEYDIHKKGMWFCHKIGCEINLCAFIGQVERRLDLPKKSYFMKTPEQNVLWICPSLFWVNNFVRRSFFTLALRCGQHYKRTKNNFDKAMYEHYRLARETKPAIKRFLNGFTLYPYDIPEQENTEGWNYLFKNIEDIQLEKLLVKPDKS